MIERFWRWLHEYCERRIKSIYMDTYHVDLKCLNCKQWASIVGILTLLPDHHFDDKVRCANCGHIENWLCEGGFWFSESTLTKESI